MNYWLMKTEPDCFGLEHLKAKPKRTEHWDGVRNYQARNFLRDGMQKGDLAFFYHSSCPEPGIAGIVKIARAAYPDHTAWDPDNEHFDPKSSPANPIWYMVDVKLEREFQTSHYPCCAQTEPGAEGHDTPAARQSAVDPAGHR